MKKEEWRQSGVPSKPGVYMFLKDGKILYVGKAANLADRTRSYFSSNLEFERGAHISKMVREADKLNWRETGSALEAVILEANLIKKYQ